MNWSTKWGIVTGRDGLQVAVLSLRLGSFCGVGVGCHFIWHSFGRSFSLTFQLTCSLPYYLTYILALFHHGRFERFLGISSGSLEILSEPRSIWAFFGIYVHFEIKPHVSSHVLSDIPRQNSIIVIESHNHPLKSLIPIKFLLNLRIFGIDFDWIPKAR